MRASFAILAALAAPGAVAQDAAWVEQWERTQRLRPASPGSAARIAPADEPGTPLVIHGRVLETDGTTPASGVVVFAYHTDRTGVYPGPDKPGWRLHGWARTDGEGRFEFRTIRPGSYPGTRVPAHVHLTIDGPALPRRRTRELRFADDPLLPEAERSRAAGVTVRDGVQHVDLELHITESGKF